MSNLNPYIAVIQQVAQAPTVTGKFLTVLYVDSGSTLGGDDYRVYQELGVLDADVTAGDVSANAQIFARSLFGARDNVDQAAYVGVQLIVGRYDTGAAETAQDGFVRVIDSATAPPEFWAVVCSDQTLAGVSGVAGEIANRRVSTTNPYLSYLFQNTSDGDFLTAGQPATVVAFLATIDSDKIAPWAAFATNQANEDYMGAVLGRSVCWDLERRAPAWKGRFWPQTSDHLPLTPVQNLIARDNELNIAGPLYGNPDVFIEGTALDGRQIAAAQTIDWIDYSVRVDAAQKMLDLAQAGLRFELTADGQAMAVEVVANRLTIAEEAGHIHPGWTVVPGEPDLVNFCVPVLANIQPVLEGKTSPITLNVTFQS